MERGKKIRSSLFNAVVLVQSEIGLNRVIGFVGATTGSVLIIRTVQCVKLVEYYMPLKNHVDQISIAM